MFKTIKSSILFLNLVFLLISCSVGSPENNSQVHIHTHLIGHIMKVIIGIILLVVMM